ncbi:hypothetical protein Hrd1104_09150 [Halorhabdus sp. CBA1104]|uniref:hypothetical protein n=1 Tax=Halorhabdus sp. CBA1104 TaxID=1380432 RepID=UPI0012B21845|nr:hypothetical protein [Halorhabdus sp. CBA1104]QGN07459.1 hypothetical protein Hrd1104_09150 [Halorhabdus sp. CBA1104]
MLPTEATHLVVPIASLDDAERTCPKLASPLDAVEGVMGVDPIEQTDGDVDPASSPALEADAIEEPTAVAEGREVPASGFTPRPGGHLDHPGRDDASSRLLTESHPPVVRHSQGGENA